MKVKICGIRTKSAARAAVEAGADALGFVFAKSKRQLQAEEAKEIIASVPASILKVGVFVNEKREKIEYMIKETGINAVQLHGDETPEFCHFSVPVIKAISIRTEEDLEKISMYDTDYILLDSPVGKYRGGNGIAFDWTLVQGRRLKQKLILAGGLNEENVSEAIQLVRPFMVDVSSGVETDGVKDHKKIKNFIHLAKADRRITNA
ncbi:phosphoribosylanthranilate isomerase [Bacillaceae bacterium Marseille-Q3522]|nr:phosphoribosylanthranilate isomerase [Bacillaceae bacterium Marseille-Q3522]